MKNVTLLLLFVSFGFMAIGQEDDDWEPIPLSAIPKYASVINPKALPVNFTTPSYNNDSLYIAENVNTDPHSEGWVSGFGKSFDNKFFKPSSTRIELDTGTVWVFKAATISGEGLSITLDSLELPKGAQLSYFYYEYDGEMYSEVNGSIYSDMTKRLFYNSWGKELYIEYFEPKSMDCGYDFKIASWGYVFARRKR